MDNPFMTNVLEPTDAEIRHRGERARQRTLLLDIAQIASEMDRTGPYGDSAWKVFAQKLIDKANEEGGA